MVGGLQSMLMTNEKFAERVEALCNDNRFSDQFVGAWVREHRHRIIAALRTPPFIKVPSTLPDELESKMRARQACKTEAAADTFTHEIGLLICGEPEAILTALRASPVIDREAVLEEAAHPKDRYRADMTERELEALARDMCNYPDIRAPVQGFAGGIPWEMHMRAYERYCAKWRGQVALINLYGRGCRGGFGTEELDDFLPGWRDELSERTKLLARVAELEAAIRALSPVGDDRGEATDG